MRILFIFAFLSYLLTPVAHAEPDNVSKSQVWIDPRCENYAYTHDMLAGQLDPGDGITVHVFWTSPGYVQWQSTDIVVFDGRSDKSIAVYADRDWPDQKTAEALLAKTEWGYDPIERALQLIHDIHAWQARNPR
ncbi:hypothetical protein FHT44_004958 [Mycolicibacterium sp. BK634]|uniref:hypothetical protein n=1 Tax=Mycolicibacterium sp. BK634 TaxID=2587099 RepID=UPI00160927A1|nr:hypothetical protein [Mycolicibacterium sp. BK634]MBB3752446.1 hypothetical protein [Mycolicibacterium sp. BK634]